MIDNIKILLQDEKTEVLEVVEGCLLDNYLLINNNRIYAIYEKYINCWTSAHSFHSAILGTKAADEIEANFYKSMNVIL